MVLGSDKDMSPIWDQAAVWSNADLLSIGHTETKFQLNMYKNSIKYV